MKCPLCNTEMEVMWEEPTGTLIYQDGSKTIEVVGHCNHCELYDGTWKIDIYASGKVVEYDLHQFFFG